MRDHTDLFVRVLSPYLLQERKTKVYRISFSGSNGLRIHENPGVPPVAPFDLNEESDSDYQHSAMSIIVNWFEYNMRQSVSIFTAAYVWSMVMVALQLIALLLLTFESRSARDEFMQPSNVTEIGFIDHHDTIRFISDNIESHRGFGSLMLLAFSGSYVLLVCVLVDTSTLFLLLITIVASSAGGIGVVVYHRDFHTEHIICAAIFIAGGLLAHVIVTVTLPFNNNILRDFVFLLTPCGLGATFLGLYWYTYVETKGTRTQYLHWWWAAACAEYLLYLSITALNLTIPGRLLRHASYRFGTMLPSIIRAYVETHSDTIAHNE